MVCILVTTILKHSKKGEGEGAYLKVKITNWFFNFKSAPGTYSEEYGTQKHVFSTAKINSGGGVREGVTGEEETHLTFGVTKLVHLVDN